MYRNSKLPILSFKTVTICTGSLRGLVQQHSREAPLESMASILRGYKLFCTPSGKHKIHLSQQSPPIPEPRKYGEPLVNFGEAQEHLVGSVSWPRPGPGLPGRMPLGSALAV